MVACRSLPLPHSRNQRRAACRFLHTKRPIDCICIVSSLLVVASIEDQRRWEGYQAQRGHYGYPVNLAKAEDIWHPTRWMSFLLFEVPLWCSYWLEYILVHGSVVEYWPVCCLS